MKLRYAPRARNDIADIHTYISEHNPQAAIAVVRAIRATASLLVRHPGVGRDTEIAGIRVLAVARYPYLVYHSIIGDNLIVVHVRHGSRAAPTKQNV
jgi:toxin ParE1/3/4